MFSDTRQPVPAATPSTDLRPFLFPQSIALIGVSQNLDSVSGRPFKYLVKYGYEGRIYPVNPKYSEIAGYRCYPSVESIPGEVDQAVVTVSAERCVPVLEECAAKGVKAAVVITSGFAEMGDDGARLQARIRHIASSSGMRVCGPNCIGLTSLPARMVATFAPGFDEEGYVQEGPAALVSQSGALGYGFYTIAQEAGLGFRYVVSTGNEVDLTCTDFIRWALEDPRIRVILGYLETIRDPEKFLAVAERAKRLRKPIIILKVGRSAVGTKAALSHTASLTGSDEVYDAAFKQAGVIRATDLDHLVELGIAFSRLPAEKAHPVGKGVAIISSSGGAGILMADKCEEWGLRVAELRPDVREELVAALPKFASALNPIDVTGQIVNDPGLFSRCLEALSKQQDIDMVVVMMSTAAKELAKRLASAIIDASGKIDAPVFVCWSGGDRLSKTGTQLLAAAGFPCYKIPGQVARVMAGMAAYGKLVEQGVDADSLLPGLAKTASELIAAVRARGGVGPSGGMTEHDSKALLKVYGIPATRETVVQSVQEAVSAASEIGYPVALKALSPDLLHKTEAGGVRLGIKDAAAVAEAYDSILESVKARYPDCRLSGVIVQEMVDGGVEMFAGAYRDPTFGPVVMVGLGGIWVEVLGDVSRRLAPVTADQALEMLGELKGRKLLEGARGRPVMDVDAVVDLIVRVGWLIAEVPEVREVDVNPFFVLPRGRGVKVVDALAIVEP